MIRKVLPAMVAVTGGSILTDRFFDMPAMPFDG
jgi:lysosomal acid lipase/cholesteryl ester hydrolase